MCYYGIMTLEDGTAIDDEYVAQTVEAFDDALRNGKVIIEPNPHLLPPLKAEFSQLPKHLQRELSPFILKK